MPDTTSNHKKFSFNGYVPWIIFVWVIGISVWLFNQMDGRVRAVEDKAQTLEIQQASMKATYEEAIKNININIGKLETYIKNK